MDQEALSRRKFLKIAGITAASVGASGGLAGVISGCGGGATTTTTASATTLSAAGTTTTVITSAEAGREVKLGVVTPQTGPLAVFGIADKWSGDLTKKTLGDGLVLGDGKKHLITLVFRDTQSDSNRAAQVAGDLIANDKVDMLLAAGAPDTVNPSADQAEAMGTPFLSVFDPWSAFVFGRSGSFDKPFKWTCGHLLGLEQICASMVDLFEKTPTNKKVAFLAMNNADGQAWLDPKTGAPPCLEAARVHHRRAWAIHAGYRGLHCPDKRVQEAGLRSPDWGQQHAGLHQLLEAEPATGIQATSAESGLGLGLSAGGRSHRTVGLWSDWPGRLMAPHLPLQRLTHRNDLPGTG